jgi:hypothetical protein
MWPTAFALKSDGHQKGVTSMTCYDPKNRNGKRKIREIIEGVDEALPAQDPSSNPSGDDRAPGEIVPEDPTEEQNDAPRPPDDADRERRRTCPITPLGHCRGEYFFFSPSGEWRSTQGGRMNAQVLASIFDGDRSWLFKHFRRENDKGEGMFNDRAASAWIMRQCATEGLIDPTIQKRGPGVWRDRSAGLLFHGGDGLLIDDEWHRAGVKRDDILYPAASRIARPASKPAGRDVGERLLAAIKLWNFEEEVGAHVVMGFIGAAFLGAAPRWRAHIMVLAPLGSGKSGLADLVAAALGGAAHPTTNNYTEAGLRQALSGMSRAMILDEAEHDEGHGRLGKVIELIRHMSGGNGARVMRGSAVGASQEFVVNACVYLSSILMGVLKPQDRSRITVVQLGRLAAGENAAGAAERARLAIEDVRGIGAGLWARAIRGFPRFLETMEVYREAFLGAECTPRVADQLATLATGRDLLLYDEVPEPGEMEAEVERFMPLIQATREEQETGEGPECLQHLLSSPIEFLRSGEHRTVAQLVMAAAGPAGTMDRRDLEAMGIKLVRSKGSDRWASWNNSVGEKPHMAISNTHVVLKRFFKGTRWAGGAHVQALRYLPGSERCRRSALRFAGLQSRAAIIPPQYLPRDDEDEYGDVDDG